jgi:putative DNA primase/helicase
MSLDTRGPLTGAAPSHLAAAVLAAGGEPLVKAMGMWLEYDPAGNHYRELTNDELKSKIWKALEGRTYPHRTPKGEAEERTLNLTTGKSADVAEALIHLTLEPGVKSLPFWRNGTREGDPDPSTLLPVRNGLLNWKTGELMRPTPRFVSTGSSTVAFDPAETTFYWDMFLDEVFDGDAEQVDLLHEVLGCIITGQAKYQKIFQVFGPGRSGKGTINRMLVELLGQEAVTSPRMSQVEQGGFGLSSLVGKTAAVLADVRLSRGRGTSALTELLLTTSGQDLQNIQRKHKDDFIGYLNAQWLMFSNEPVLMQDLTGVVATRMVLLETRRSFLGNEDPDLFQRDLLPEAAGVLNRCLDGARRLSARGRFLVPRSIQGRQREILREASTVSAFASECLVSDGAASASKQAVYDAYETYCRGHGRTPTDQNVFWRDLRSSGKFNDAMVQRLRRGHERVQTVNGLRVELDPDTLPLSPGDDFDD